MKSSRIKLCPKTKNSIKKENYLLKCSSNHLTCSSTHLKSSPREKNCKILSIGLRVFNRSDLKESMPKNNPKKRTLTCK